MKRSPVKGLYLLLAVVMLLGMALAPAVAGAAPVAPYSDGNPMPTEKGTAFVVASATEALGGAGSGIVAAGNWLLTQQDAAGWFPYTPGGSMTGNTQGTTARGLLNAYGHSGSAAFKMGAVANGDFYLTPPYPRSYLDGDPRFTTNDTLFIEELSALTADPQYAAFLQTYFWSKLSSGTYGENDDLDAAEWAAFITAGRNGQGIVDLAPWDLSAAPIAAQLAGEATIRDAFMAEIVNALNLTTVEYTGNDVISLAGAVWAGALTGYNINPTAGAHASIDSTAGLAAKLASYQYSDGAWGGGSGYVSTDPASHETQTTAFAILALKAMNDPAYADEVARGAAFIRSVQTTSGEFLSYPGAAANYGGSVEAHAEALAALATVASSVIYVDSSWSGTTAGADPDGAGPATAYGWDAFSTVAEGIDAVAPNGTVNVAAGTYPTTSTIIANKALTLTGPTSGIAKLQGTNSAVVPVLEISASNVTVQNLEFSHTSLLPKASAPTPWLELPNSLVRVTNGTGLTGITITGNKMYVPAQPGAMSDWNGVALTVGTSAATGISITNNTIHNTRNGIVVQGNISASISNNTIYDTKGGIMNYTGSQADADQRVMSGNTWGATHNEWDIVWNSGGLWEPADRVPGVLGVSTNNNGAYVLDLRYPVGGGTTTVIHNRSHAFVNAVTGTTTKHGANGNFNLPYATLELGMEALVPGGTMIVAGSGTYTYPAGTHPGGVVVTGNGAKIYLNGATIGAGSPAFTIVGDDDEVLGPGALTGGGSGSPAVLVQAGADDFLLKDVDVSGWADGVQVAGAVTSLKIVNNYIHQNTGAGLQVDAAVGGVQTVEGNLFKNNGEAAITSAAALNAQYNSFGSMTCPSYANVDVTNCTFAEVFIDVDRNTTGEQTMINVDETRSFDVSVLVDAKNLYGFAFKFNYDQAKLVKNSAQAVVPTGYACLTLPGLAANEIGYQCAPSTGNPVINGVVEVGVATFTAMGSDLTGNGSWNAYFDVDPVASTAGTANGALVYLNNVKLAGLANARDITETTPVADDGKVVIRGIANFTGFIDVQGRADDSGAELKVFASNALTGAELAIATSAKGGAYTTVHTGGNILTMLTPYYFLVDKPLYVKTAVGVSAPNKVLSTRPLTSLNLLVLKGGDATNNEAIDVDDATCIGGAYGAAPVVCGGGLTPGSADVNGDGKVDILDLTLMGGNYGVMSSTWMP